MRRFFADAVLWLVRVVSALSLALGLVLVFSGALGPKRHSSDMMGDSLDLFILFLALIAGSAAIAPAALVLYGLGVWGNDAPPRPWAVFVGAALAALSALGAMVVGGPLGLGPVGLAMLAYAAAALATVLGNPIDPFLRFLRDASDNSVRVVIGCGSLLQLVAFSRVKGGSFSSYGFAASSDSVLAAVCGMGLGVSTAVALWTIIATLARKPCPGYLLMIWGPAHLVSWAWVLLVWWTAPPGHLRPY